MKLESKFDINNLVKHKFEKTGDDYTSCLEVMQINTDTCYGGTQIFYLVRLIVAHKKYEHDYKKEGPFEWTVHHGIDKEGNKSIAWEKYREDELISCTQEEIDIILGN